MLLSGFVEENFTDYKYPTMTIGFPNCTFKCGEWCQNYCLKNSKRIEYPLIKLVDRYLKNDLTQGIVCAGLEPFDDFNALYALIDCFRARTEDVIIIYTGYNKDEIKLYVEELQKRFSNIIVKFGRFIPNCESHYDEVLGVELKSPNQYAEYIC